MKTVIVLMEQQGFLLPSALPADLAKAIVEPRSIIMEQLLWQNRGLILLIATAALGLLIKLRGAGPEKAVVAVMLSMLVVDRLNHFIASGGTSFWTVSSYWEIEMGHLFIDGFALLFFVAIGIRANRIYPLWIAGMQIIAMFSHFSRELSPYIHPTAYAIINRAPFYLQIITLLIGFLLHIRRSKRIGKYRSWRTF